MSSSGSTKRDSELEPIAESSRVGARISPTKKRKSGMEFGKSRSSIFRWGGLKRDVRQSLEGKAVQIVVGDGDASRTWTLPKALLWHHSTYFQTKCNDDSEETTEKLLLLPNEDPDTFELFVEFMYTGGFSKRIDDCAGWDTPGLKEITTESDIEGNDVVSWTGKAGVCTWVLGDHLGSVDFKNYAMRFLFATCTPHGDDSASYIDPGSIIYAYKNTFAGSKLRQFFIDATRRYWGNRDVITGMDKNWKILLRLEEEFRNELVLALEEDSDERMDKYLAPIKDYLEFHMEQDATPMLISSGEAILNDRSSQLSPTASSEVVI